MYVFRVIMFIVRGTLFIYMQFITFTKYIMDNSCIKKILRFQLENFIGLCPKKLSLKNVLNWMDVVIFLVLHLI